MIETKLRLEKNVIANYIKTFALAVIFTTATSALGQDITVSGSHARPASPIIETTQGKCEDRDISFKIERKFTRNEPSVITTSLYVGTSRIDLTDTTIGRDLQQSDIAMRFFILCRANGFAISGFGFRASEGSRPPGLRLLASFDDTGRLISNTGLIPESVEIVAHGLD